MSFLRSILKIVFTAGVVFLFFNACTAHKYCGATDAKKKYHSKRYNSALRERDSLCNITHMQQTELTALNTKLSELQARFTDLESRSGSELNKLNKNVTELNKDLTDKQNILKQREERLRQLETVMRRQDSILNRLNASVKNALLGFNPDELTVEMRNGRVYVSMSDKLLFKSGDANVETKGKEALKKLAEVLNKNQDVSIAIEGHTDNVPIKTSQYKDNWDLSAARATNVVRLLINEYGMDARRLTASGKGEYFPVASNETTEGKAKNRRTEIVLSPKLEELMKLIANNNQ
jgi:chemotaxis protein MotB